MQQDCRQCSASFEITAADLEFYDKVSPIFHGKKELIPPPTLCPQCRQQRRSAWRNERSLHPRICSRCNRKIVAVYPADAPFPVYCHKCWWSEEWDPREFGVPLDLSRSFIEQCAELLNRVPHLAMMNDNGVNSENCEYTYDFSFGKNCYMVCGSWFIEDSYYCAAPNTRCKFIVDSYFLAESEICYECLDSRRLYNCRYLQNCEGCTDCIFGYDLKGCSDCVGCFGLRQKRFHWFNESLSEEEYKARLAAFDRGSYRAIEQMKVRFRAVITTLPRRGMQLVNCEDCTGDYLFGCHDVKDSYLIFDAEHCRYCDRGEGQKFSYDLLHTGFSQFCYEGLTPDNSYMTCFSMWCWYTKQLLYSDNCHHSEHLFGCASMKRSKFCILNKQYTEEEYMTLVPQIIEQMRQRGEWGEPFPTDMSPFGYNETMAQDYFPLSRSEVETRGWTWREPQSDDINGTDASALPDRIQDTSQEILTSPIRCLRSGRVFRMIKQEVDFYKAHAIPLPRLHPTERHKDRFNAHNPEKIWNRQCAKCSKDIQTTYPPDSSAKVYCESCYLETVY